MRPSIGILLLAVVGCASGPDPVVDAPPVAERHDKTLVMHGHERVDPYYWLNERENPEVIAYLEAENAYTEAKTAHLDGLQQELFEEIKGRIKQDDSSVPYFNDGYWYYTRFEEGKDYPFYCRKQGSLDAPEQVMLDVNAMAEEAGTEYFQVSGRAVSLDGDKLAYGVDKVGRRIYEIHVKDLTTGELLSDRIPDVSANVTWAADNRTLFYTKQDPTTLRRYQIYRHTLGSDAAEDVLVYQEDDDTFSTFVFRTKSDRYLMIGSTQTLATEYRYLPADEPTGEFRLFEPRRRDHEYFVDHFDDHFYIRTNLDAKNFRLMRTPVAKTARANWSEVVPHRDDTLLEGFEIFREHLVLDERRGGLTRLRVKRWDGGEDHYIEFNDPAYLAAISVNPDFETTTLRFFYSSMTTPSSTYDYDMVSRERELLKQDEVLGGFDAADYVSERLHATATDGTEVPISLVYRRGFAKDGSAPLLLYGYGSYGSTLDASFSAARLSLLDRGFVYAIAHVRGGEELGREWYEGGKLLNKRNTFTDFIDCGRYLVEQGYTAPDRLFARGGSAGGLLMGAVINMAPELFHGVVADVPFVDVVTTMLDDSIPLTTGEYDEWGNPNDKTYYDYMLSYSPYDQVRAVDYPNLLVTTGLHDSQVQYWEPAKWVARLRATKTDDNLLLLKTNMSAGHGGASARDARYERIAFRYAFLLDLAGKG